MMIATVGGGKERERNPGMKLLSCLQSAADTASAIPRVIYNSLRPGANSVAVELDSIAPANSTFSETRVGEEAP
jgi:hypothetical protein